MAGWLYDDPDDGLTDDERRDRDEKARIKAEEEREAEGKRERLEAEAIVLRQIRRQGYYWPGGY